MGVLKLTKCSDHLVFFVRRILLIFNYSGCAILALFLLINLRIQD